MSAFDDGPHDTWPATLPSVMIEVVGRGSCRVGAGAVVGRLATAGLRLDDDDVSEAHALISLRGGALHILSLRGRIEVDGETRTEVRLEPGRRIRLGRGAELRVDSVSVPPVRHVLEGIGRVPLEITEPVLSVLLEATPALASGVRPGAAAVVRAYEGGLWMRVRGEAPELMRSGESWDLQGHSVRYVALAGEGERQTVLHTPRPLRLVSEGPVVWVVSPPGEPLPLAGLAAELLRVLARSGDPLHWESLCARLWRVRDQAAWRQRLDALRKDLRSRLRAAGLRDDVVWSSVGYYRLNLHPSDALVGDGWSSTSSG